MERVGTHFEKLNIGWDAEPGAPHPEIRVEDHTLILTFYLNPWVFPGVKPGDVGELRFESCWRYRLGDTNDEGWWMRQCRFSVLAPDWGEFYKVEGDLRLERLPSDAWTLLAVEPVSTPTHHYLFYFKDDTFECDAESWSFRTIPAGGNPVENWERVTLSSGSSVLIVPPRSGREVPKMLARTLPWFWYFIPSAVRRWWSKRN